MPVCFSKHPSFILSWDAKVKCVQFFDSFTASFSRAGHRGAGTSARRCFRGWPYNRTGSCLCLPDHWWYCDQSPLACHQWPDYCRAGDRSDPPPSSHRWHKGSGQRQGSGQDRSTPPDFPNSELVRLRLAGRERDPSLRRGQHSDHAAPAGDAGGPDRSPASPPQPTPSWAIGTGRPIGGTEFFRPGRPQDGRRGRL